MSLWDPREVQGSRTGVCHTSHNVKALPYSCPERPAIEERGVRGCFEEAFQYYSWGIRHLFVSPILSPGQLRVIVANASPSLPEEATTVRTTVTLFGV